VAHPTAARARGAGGARREARYFLAPTGLEALAIGVGVESLWPEGRPRRRILVAYLLVVVALALFSVGADALGGWALRVDENDVQRTPRLSLPRHAPVLDCRLEEGRLWTIEPLGASIKLAHTEPPVGERARIGCTVDGARTLVVEALEPGGAPVVPCLLVDGREVWRAAELTAPARVPIAGARTIELRVEATAGPGRFGHPAGVTLFSVAAD
jgi:hypothetical protein